MIIAKINVKYKIDLIIQLLQTSCVCAYMHIYDDILSQLREYYEKLLLKSIII